MPKKLHEGGPPMPAKAADDDVRPEKRHRGVVPMQRAWYDLPGYPGQKINDPRERPKSFVDKVKQGRWP